ncbi:MAG: uracil phosphoribosyltransferase [Alphaproteobacteria bacterium]|nr:uracil phosphoribosyltransferase [Alphaproteobacteria bacterium]
MTPDTHYLELPRPAGGVAHDYGEQVHLLSFPYPMSLLAELSSPETGQPRFNQILNTLYEWLLAEVASRELATVEVSQPTRMQAINPEGVYQGQVIDRAQRVVIVALARAGILPGMRFFDLLNHLVEPAGVRQDHVFMGRVTNAAGEVVGVDVSGSKIGGPVRDATVLIPDPMGATGRSAIEALRLYRDKIEGPPRALVAIHLIITPEYIARVKKEVPEAKIYAIRLDRGLSDAEALAARPGALPEQERGLNDSQYIVPGAGGLGELMNNAWV